MKNSLLLMAIFFIGFSSAAFEFTPSVMTYTASGRNATQKYNIHNSLPATTAVEIRATTREVDKNGKETLVPTKDFNIYPKLFKLKPGETRVVKVTYVGDKNVTREKSYRIIAEQLSVDLKKKEAAKNETNMAINFLYKYETSAYVTPDNSAPDVSVQNFEVHKEGKEPFLEVVFVNSGNAHQVFQNWQLEVETEKGVQVIDKTTYPELAEFNLLGGNQVSVKIPWSEKTKGTPKSIKYKIN